MTDAPETASAEPKRIPLDPCDLQVLSKYIPDIQRGRKAQDAVNDYLSAIVRRSGFGPTQKFDLDGKNIVIIPEQADAE